ncbi:hypothetical protein PUP66_20655 [Pseudomonas chlororaphis]|uniref:hypothetical protein n=1 Tax=Pseudomonas chlororaphis TaxID=587753 RepID=UPI000F54EEE9|nr:hypothetical protein [Pseudomonas chlororaphis]AZD16901.1 hypothetical protein C4K25_3980 [Pseudomonas chlororaphis]WDH45502.1 hypothetical protein PUP66_20655 [Pseudomonas chlororaphis]WDH57349.1 hypothetical protein PUP56_20660 [Pseudomonas chlororaphis]WQE16607.1 hypothetical protein U0007_19475 [Pseudomonas chlororaphis]
MEYTGIQFSALASYRNNALFTTFSKTADLAVLESPAPDLSNKKVSDVLGVHVHEYIHQTHNFSTTAGLQLLKSRLVALQIFATGTNDNGHYIRQGQTYKHINKNVLSSFEKEYSQILGDTRQIVQEGFLSDFQFDFFDTVESTDDPNDPCQTLGVRMGYKLGGINQSIVIGNIGYNIITEGIAYEIERSVRNRITGEMGSELEYSTPVLPYRLYRPIVEALVGRACTVEELVKVGTFALQNKIPSLGLKAAAFALQQEILDHFTIIMEADNQEAVTSYRATIDSLLTTTFAGTAVKKGLKILDQIVMGAIQRRAQSPYFELEFLREPLTLEVFKGIIRDQELPARCILQEKSDCESELYWMGNDVSKLSDLECGAISTLQCALQYSHLHLAPTGRFNNTVYLPNSPHNLSCPYLNACPLRETKSDPALCAQSPWLHDLDIESGNVCWYVNGVKSMRNPKYKDYDDSYA